MAAFDDFLWAIAQQESGGNYGANNGIAVGKYQILKSNVPEWTARWAGRSMSWQQFLADPAAQEAVGRGQLGEYFDKYGADGAASAWYSGDPSLKNSTRPQSGGPSIHSYVQSVLALMARAPGGGSTAPAGPPASAGAPGVVDASWPTSDWILPLLRRLGGGTGGSNDVLAGTVGTVFGPISNTVVNMGEALAVGMHALTWLVNPMNWVRIIAGVSGAAAVVAGTVFLVKSA